MHFGLNLHTNDEIPMLHALIAVFIIMALLAEMTETGLRIVIFLAVILLVALCGGLLYLLWYLAFVEGHVAYALILASFPVAFYSLVGIFYSEHPALSFAFLVLSGGVLILSLRHL